MRAEERYWNDLRLLKETVRNALNWAERNEFFSDAQDSTSCLTAILYFEKSPDIKFKFDVAITTKNKNGNYMRLIHNKNVYALGLDQYTWNEVPNSHQVKDKADEIKEEGLWQKVRDRYLEKKNMYSALISDLLALILDLIKTLTTALPSSLISPYKCACA